MVLARVQHSRAGERVRDGEAGREKMIEEDRERVRFRLHKYNMNSIH